MSEIKGLTKDSISEDGYITIKQVSVNVGGKEIKKNQAKQFTRNRKQRIPDYVRLLIDKVETDDLVPMSSKMIYYHFSAILQRNNLKHMSFHDLRHLNASMMAVLQIPDKYAQERGGWKTDRVMKKVYTHTFSRERQEVDNRIGDYFNEIIGSQPGVDTEKYKAWLLLFDKKDCEESMKEFIVFSKSMT